MPFNRKTNKFQDIPSVKRCHTMTRTNHTKNMDECHKCHTEQEKSTRTTEKTEYSLSFHLHEVQKDKTDLWHLQSVVAAFPGGCGASGTVVNCYFLIGCWLCKCAYSENSPWLVLQKRIKTPARVAQIQNTDSTQCWRARGEAGTPLHCRWEYKTAQPLWSSSVVS